MPKEGEDAEVNGADAWWNSTMPRPHDPSTQDKTLYKEGDNTPRDEHIKLIQKYAGKPVPAGFRGIWDEIPSPERLNADIPHKVEKFVRASKVHKYDTEEEKRKKQKAYDNLSLAEQRAFDRAQSAASKKSEQDEADAVTTGCLDVHACDHKSLDLTIVRRVTDLMWNSPGRGGRSGGAGAT